VVVPLRERFPERENVGHALVEDDAADVVRVVECGERAVGIRFVPDRGVGRAGERRPYLWPRLSGPADDEDGLRLLKYDGHRHAGSRMLLTTARLSISTLFTRNYWRE